MVGTRCMADGQISPVMTRPDAVLKQVIYYPYVPRTALLRQLTCRLRLFSRNMKGGHTLHLPPTADV